jgi:hypothetical protein
MVNCANGIDDDPLPVGHKGVAYRRLLQGFEYAKQQGVTIGQPKVLIGGKASQWPNYPTGGSLKKEICAQLANPPAACSQQ